MYSNPTITLDKKYMLSDANGEFARRQMITAGAYGGAEALVEELLGAIGVLKEQETGMQLLEEKAAVEEKLTAMEMLLLELASSLDGIPTNISGILCDEDGTIHQSTHFAKRILLTEPTRENVGIDSLAVYFYLNPKYVVIPDLLKEIVDLSNEDDEVNVDKMFLRNRVNDMVDILDSTILETQHANRLVEEMISLQYELKPEIARYEEMLEQSGDLLSGEWKEMLSESLSSMHAYVGNSESFYDLPSMRERLKKNEDILMDVRKSISSYISDSYEQRAADILKISEALEEYSIAGLSIRYADMHRGTTMKNSFLKAIKNFFAEGLTAGIINASEISSQRINNRQLPSKTIGLDEVNLFGIDIPDGILDNDGTAVWTMIRKLNLSKAVTILRNEAENLLEKTLLVSYDGTHFSDYVSGGEKSPLKYEMEYILYGNASDSDNLRRAALTILGIRLVMNLIHTFTNPEKRERALVTATEVFGVGIPFLTIGCQYVILFAWGLQNAKLETVEIMKGKRVPFLVTGTSFQIDYGEIATMSKETRFERAEKYEDNPGVSPRYKSYLLLFMMFRKDETLVMRSMDLIQEMLQMDNPKFLLKDCYAGLSVTVNTVIESRYSNLSFTSFDSGNGATVEAVGTVLY